MFSCTKLTGSFAMTRGHVLTFLAMLHALFEAALVNYLVPCSTPTHTISRFVSTAPKTARHPTSFSVIPFPWGGKTTQKMTPFKVKNDKPDDFSTYSVMVCVLSFNQHSRGSFGDLTTMLPCFYFLIFWGGLTNCSTQCVRGMWILQF